MRELEFLVTLWPTFSHFNKFAIDKRLAAVRLNSAMVNASEMNNELEKASKLVGHVPLYFDIKGKQLRIIEVDATKKNLEITLNHQIEVDTPVPVLFKAGADYAFLDHVENGNKLIFRHSPEFMVYSGESIHIRHPSFEVKGPTFLPYEIEKIKKAKKAGFKNYFLSYVESQKDIDEFRSFVGNGHIIAKIESQKGLNFVTNEYKPQPNLNLMAARGDLYVEVEKPHNIISAMKLIIEKDPNAYVGSRLLLSLCNEPVPSSADFSDLAWLYDIGYRRMMLCDELCLKDNLLSTAVNVLETFRNTYAKR